MQGGESSMELLVQGSCETAVRPRDASGYVFLVRLGNELSASTQGTVAISAGMLPVTLVTCALK